MDIPKDPILLLSYINTQLRDNYADLQDFCLSQQIKMEEVVEKMHQTGYEYNSSLHQFTAV